MNGQDPWEALKDLEELQAKVEAERQAAEAAWEEALADTPPQDESGGGPAVVMQPNGYCVGCYPPRRACAPCLIRWNRLHPAQ